MQYGEKRSKLKDPRKILVRVNSSGEIRDSMPCYNCLKFMKKHGVKKVIYSTNDGYICADIAKIISACKKVKIITADMV